MSLKRWLMPSADENINGLAAGLGCGRPLAGILAARGFSGAGQAEEFLCGTEVLPDPMSLKDMDRAVERIRAALENGEKIEIFGDYDVDGITSTALLLEYLESCGADVCCSLPARGGDGYGLSVGAVERMAADGTGLIITVDNGVSASVSVRRAAELGLDVIVTDHHKVPEELPPAVAVVDPLRPDDESGLDMLAGVGVALNTVAALEGCSVADVIDVYGAYAAMGTVSDVMPLRGENRYIVRNGLNVLRTTDHLGLKALAEIASVRLPEIDERGIAFCLAPRLNAAGRMATADVALELLLTDDPQRAMELAQQLSQLNTQRQQTEKQMMDMIERSFLADPDCRDRMSMVFASDRFFSGVSGVVCSKLAEKYEKPAIVISVENGEGKGSGRGYGSASLYDAIMSASDLLDRFGGHEMAAGFHLSADNIRAFSDRVEEFYRDKAKEVYEETLCVDYIAEFSELREREVRELEKMAPFGACNPEPVIATLGAKVTALTPCNDRHTRVNLCKNGTSICGMVFGCTPERLPYAVGDIVDVAYTVSIYAGSRGNLVSYRITDVRPAGLPDSSVRSAAEYRALKCGGDRPDFTLTRDDIGEVYRKIRRSGTVRDRSDAIAFAFAGKDLGTVLSSVDVLLELGLLLRRTSGGESFLYPAPDPDKQDLQNSSLFRLLS